MRVLDVATQADADVTGHLDALIGLYAELLDRGPVGVIAFVGHLSQGEFCHLQRRFRKACGSAKVLRRESRR